MYYSENILINFSIMYDLLDGKRMPPGKCHKIVFFTSGQFCISIIFYCCSFIPGEHLNENTLVFKNSSASMTSSLLFTASTVVLVT